jgi:hypothetical protein
MTFNAASDRSFPGADVGKVFATLAEVTSEKGVRPLFGSTAIIKKGPYPFFGCAKP